MKRCSRCHEIKDASGFYRRGDGSLRGPCRECWLADMRSPVTRQKNAASKRRANLIANYGMTELDYAKLLVDQEGKCAVCRKPELSTHRNGQPFRLSVDHDHSTDRIRGLLCHRCNRAIGLLGDDAALLRRAAEYLTDEAPAALEEAQRLLTGKDGQ